MKVNMSFFMKNNEFLEKYNEIWDNVSNTIKKDLIMSLYILKLKNKSLTAAKTQFQFNV